MKSFLQTKNLELSIGATLLETKRQLQTNFLIFSKSSMKEGSSDICLFGYQAK